jgi:hypothetical protein
MEINTAPKGRKSIRAQRDDWLNLRRPFYDEILYSEECETQYFEGVTYAYTNEGESWSLHRVVLEGEDYVIEAEIRVVPSDVSLARWLSIFRAIVASIQPKQS